MTPFWFTVTVLGFLVIFVAMFLDSSLFGPVYMFGAALLVTGPAIAIARHIDRRQS